MHSNHNIQKHVHTQFNAEHLIKHLLQIVLASIIGISKLINAFIMMIAERNNGRALAKYNGKIQFVAMDLNKSITTALNCLLLQGIQDQIAFQIRIIKQIWET